MLAMGNNIKFDLNYSPYGLSGRFQFLAHLVALPFLTSSISALKMDITRI